MCGATSEETAAVQTCLDTEYIVSPRLLLSPEPSERGLTNRTNLDRISEAFSNLKHGGGAKMHNWGQKRVFRPR